MELKTIVIIAVSLLYCPSNSQVLEEMEAVLVMKNIVDKLDKLVKHIEEKDKNIEDSFRSIEQTIQDLRVEFQQCAQRSQVDTFQNVFTIGQQEILSSVQQCPCKDEITDFRNLLGNDECLNGTHNCSKMATCTDTPGLYKCTCLPGYTGNGFTCQDVNECTSGTYQCHSKATCVNTNGSYRCQCHSLYSGDGLNTCDPVCEHPSLHVPSLGCISLVTAKGQFKAGDNLDGETNKLDWHQALSKCQESGRHLLGTVTRQQLEDIINHFHPYMGGLCCAKVGVKHAKWIANNTTVDSGLWNSKSGEPTGGEQECGYAGKNNEGNIHLYDGKCSGTSYALCQHHY